MKYQTEKVLITITVVSSNLQARRGWLTSLVTRAKDSLSRGYGFVSQSNACKNKLRARAEGSKKILSFKTMKKPLTFK